MRHREPERIFFSRKWAKTNTMFCCFFSKMCPSYQVCIITALYSLYSISTGLPLEERVGFIYSLWTSPAYRNRWQIDHAAQDLWSTSHMFYSFGQPLKRSDHRGNRKKQLVVEALVKENGQSEWNWGSPATHRDLGWNCSKMAQRFISAVAGTSRETSPFRVRLLEESKSMQPFRDDPVWISLHLPTSLVLVWLLTLKPTGQTLDEKLNT